MRRAGGCSKLFRAFSIILTFGTLFAVAGAYFLYRALTTPFKGYEGNEKIVEVKRGWTSATIMRQLQRQGVLRDDVVPLIFLKALRRGESLKAGIYQFKGETSPVDVIDKLVRGDVLLKSITIREGLDRFAIGQLMAAEKFGTVEQ